MLKHQVNRVSDLESEIILTALLRSDEKRSLILETPVTPKAEEVELCRQGPMHHPRGLTSEIEGSKAATPAPKH